jgi:hypothetical protein
MARKRSGVSTWQLYLRTACRVSHFPAFADGVTLITGPEVAVPLLEAWFTFCTLFEAYLASDDYPWEIDDSSPITFGDG